MPCYIWLRYKINKLYNKKIIIKRGIIQMQALNHRINFRERGPQSLCLGGRNLTQEFVH